MSQQEANLPTTHGAVRGVINNNANDAMSKADGGFMQSEAGMDGAAFTVINTNGEKVGFLFASADAVELFGRSASGDPFPVRIDGSTILLQSEQIGAQFQGTTTGNVLYCEAQYDVAGEPIFKIGTTPIIGNAYEETFTSNADFALTTVFQKVLSGTLVNNYTQANSRGSTQFRVNNSSNAEVTVEYYLTVDGAAVNPDDIFEGVVPRSQGGSDGVQFLSGTDTADADVTAGQDFELWARMVSGSGCTVKGTLYTTQIKIEETLSQTLQKMGVGGINAENSSPSLTEATLSDLVNYWNNSTKAYETTSFQLLKNTLDIADTIVMIKSAADLPTAVSDVITIAIDNVTYVFDGSIDLGNDRLLLTGANVELRGTGSSNSNITSSTTGDLITIQQSATIREISLISASSPNLINASDANTDTLTIERVAFVAGGTGILIDDYSASILSRNAFTSGVTNGIHMTGNVDSIIISDSIFLSNTGTHINLNSSTTKGISINHNASTLTPSSTFLNIASNSGNIISNGLGSIEYNKIDSNAGGTVISGYSPFDDGWVVIGNAGIKDSDRLEPNGFGFYVDDNTGGAIVAGDGQGNAVLFTVNGLGTATNTSKLPLSILGSGQLWDTSTNTITPIVDGDTYNLRIDFTITDTFSNPTFIAFQLDIGSLSFPDIIVVTKTETLRTGGLPQEYSIDFPIFSAATFLANGGKVYVWCNSGTADLENRKILISRTSSGVR